MFSSVCAYLRQHYERGNVPAHPTWFDARVIFFVVGVVLADGFLWGRWTIPLISIGVFLLGAGVALLTRWRLAPRQG